MLSRSKGVEIIQPLILHLQTGLQLLDM